SETFLSGLLRAHLEGYLPGAPHSRALAKALTVAAPRMGPAGRLLLEAVPEILDPTGGPERLAARMADMSDPFAELMRLGVRNPHGPGFMELAHLALTERVRSGLARRDLIDWYVNWLRPPGREARTSGAERAIEALVHPWLTSTPGDDLRSYLVETVIEMYGDPRIKSGGVWAGVGAAEMGVIHRWLTREDMRFFTGVVDAAQKDAMWPKRRDFWLRLFDERLIDAAWVAFSSQAMEFARERLMRQDARNAESRFGFQRARQNTSLLIMKIGNKIMVDGCHSYKTHVFDQDDPMAPKLFQEGYDCEEIRLASPESKSHSSIDSWQRWVRDMINADVRRSRAIRPYTKVFRPRGLGPRYRPALRTATAAAGPAPLRRVMAPRQTSHHTGRAPDASGVGPILPQTISGAAQASAPRGRGTGQDASRPLEAVPSTKAQMSPLLDLLIRTGPPAATALLEQFTRLENNRMRALLSPKVKAGLEWIQSGQGPMPGNLQGAIEHYLATMEKFGQGPAGIISRAGQAHLTSTSQAGKFPPLPPNGDECIEIFRQNVDAMEGFARKWPEFGSSPAVATALAKLRSRNLYFQLPEIEQLHQLYEQMHRHSSRGNR
ncbi:MAG: hypothetical protein JJU40_07080, partial [Rhodobacteraceae bacterium]|nr:hypothetical protein [Paracoccaceae bacterium]